MHKFYITNNLGGGGTNVSRFVDYKELFNLPHIGLLLNYYYLTGQSTHKFDTRIINSVTNFTQIGDFLNWAKDEFKKSRSVSSAFTQSSSPTPINGYMLDNGCGNLLRDVLQGGEHDKDVIKNLVVPFLNFAEALHFDFSIALDYAMKYTYKDGERKDVEMKRLWEELASDEKINLSLIEETLLTMASTGYTHDVYAPLHGFSFDSFESYLNSVLESEERVEATFGGFALGGIANFKALKAPLWDIPEDITGDAKSGYVSSRLCRMIRNYTERPIHVLGAGNIYYLPFIIQAGATSSDCHSAWRRSSDGGYEKAKILVPLLDEHFNFVNDHDALQYIKVKDLDDSYNFSFGYSIDELKRLFRSTNKEDLYFAEIVTYYQAIRQYELIIQYTEKYPDFIEKLKNTPDQELNATYTLLDDRLSNPDQSLFAE